jgi:hypothetical protein
MESGEDDTNGSSRRVCISFSPGDSKQRVISDLKQIIRHVEIKDLPERTRLLPQRDAGMTLMAEAFTKVAQGRIVAQHAAKILGLPS